MFSSLDLLRAHRWSNSFFTTFSLSLSFFEAVVLDALVRQSVGDILVLADVEGVRAALAEHGARRAGRSYEVEPVAVNGGCFHPKLMALTSATEAHIVVGSGNLTFGGWGANLECVEHLHPGFAADAFDDAADFLESLATSPRVRYEAGEPSVALAQRLRGRASGGVRTGRVRLVHSLDRAILDQLVDLANDLGGARQLTVAAPFFDAGVALDQLCSRLDIDRVAIHSHEGGTVVGTVGSNWPAHVRTPIDAVAVEHFSQAGPRPLHAKLFEVVCRRGRLLVSGSANATMAALGKNHNVELCVARISRETTVGWKRSPASPPAKITPPAAEETKAEDKDGVLRAVLRGDKLDGLILTAFPSGEARIYKLAGSGPVEVGAAVVAADGRFTVIARDLERQGWSSQRLILRVVSAEGRTAHGFVSFAELAEITRRAGSIAPRLFAVLAGTETPEDIAALMNWFHDNPNCLKPETISGAGDSASSATEETVVAVASLLNPNVQTELPHVGSDSGAAAWHRFMDHILACFRERRGPIALGSGSNAASVSEETNEDENDPVPPRDDPYAGRALAAFERLFEAMLGSSPDRRELGLAFRIAQYICDRLEPDAGRVLRYLDQLVSAFIAHPPPEKDQHTAVAAVLVHCGAHSALAGSSFDARAARRKLMRLGADLAGPMPDMDLARGFARLVAPDLDATAMWTVIGAVKTAQEEVAAYRRAGAGPLAPAEFPALASMPEWPRLAVGLHGSSSSRILVMRRHSTACPQCHIALPTTEANRLRTKAVATASNCCGRILLCEEI